VSIYFKQKISKKMKPKLTSALFASLIAMALFSCKDDDESPSKTDLLAKKWKIVKYVEDGVDESAEFTEACQIDNYFEFAKGGTFHEEAGTELCYDGEEDSDGTWEWKEKETILSIKYADDDHVFDYTVVQLTSSSLKVSGLDDDDEQRDITFEPF
jgi:hypothetical protein